MLLSLFVMAVVVFGFFGVVFGFWFAAERVATALRLPGAVCSVLVPVGCFAAVFLDAFCGPCSSLSMFLAGLWLLASPVALAAVGKVSGRF